MSARSAIVGPGRFPSTVTNKALSNVSFSIAVTPWSANHLATRMRVAAVSNPRSGCLWSTWRSAMRSGRMAATSGAGT